MSWSGLPSELKNVITRYLDTRNLSSVILVDKSIDDIEKYWRDKVSEINDKFPLDGLTIKQLKYLHRRYTKHNVESGKVFMYNDSKVSKYIGVPNAIKVLFGLDDFPITILTDDGDLYMYDTEKQDNERLSKIPIPDKVVDFSRGFGVIFYVNT